MAGLPSPATKTRWMQLSSGRLGQAWVLLAGCLSFCLTTWMKLASMDLTAEDVIDRGGINAAARGPESASEADLPGNLGRELAEAEAAISDTKREYYDALSRRNAALRAISKGGKANE